MTPRVLRSTIIFVALVTKFNFPNSTEKEGICLRVIKGDLAEKEEKIFDNEVFKLVTMNTQSGIFRHSVDILALTGLVIQQSVILHEGESGQTLLALPHDVQCSQPSAYDRASRSEPEVLNLVAGGALIYIFIFLKTPTSDNLSNCFLMFH